MDTIRLETVESTNLYGKEHLAELADKTIVHALRQTCGRGRLQRSWVDLGEGNLFMSFVLKPSNSFDEVFSNLTQYLSVQLCKILEEYGLNPQIKWPNDVLIDGKKTAGILSETVMQGCKFKGLILGVGVNLRADADSVKKITDKEVTALNIELGKTIDLDSFRESLCKAFFSEYDEFLKSGFEMIKTDYLKRACFLEKEICVKVFDKEKQGIAKSITDKGELVLCENNKDFVLTIGDIL
uniref:biotin--[acetyl-CoA-carboxylase] ligase n=1 Tax=Candidatus Scatousia sp. TaxID=3085663 RepID=UPI004027B09F